MCKFLSSNDAFIQLRIILDRGRSIMLLLILTRYLPENDRGHLLATQKIGVVTASNSNQDDSSHH